MIGRSAEDSSLGEVFLGLGYHAECLCFAYHQIKFQLIGYRESFVNASESGTSTNEDMFSHSFNDFANEEYITEGAIHTGGQMDGCILSRRGNNLVVFANKKLKVHDLKNYSNYLNGRTNG
uniref:Uncharacterized protein n=1 Tax=Glossina palpalis gambiensis TaxID=67801 RepID=A0A1B0BNX1_9MUSC